MRWQETKGVSNLLHVNLFALSITTKLVHWKLQFDHNIVTNKKEGKMLGEKPNKEKISLRFKSCLKIAMKPKITIYQIRKEHTSMQYKFQFL